MVVPTKNPVSGTLTVFPSILHFINDSLQQFRTGKQAKIIRVEFVKRSDHFLVNFQLCFIVFMNHPVNNKNSKHPHVERLFSNQTFIINNCF